MSWSWTEPSKRFNRVQLTKRVKKRMIQRFPSKLHIARVPPRITYSCEGPKRTRSVKSVLKKNARRKKRKETEIIKREVEEIRKNMMGQQRNMIKNLIPKEKDKIKSLIRKIADLKRENSLKDARIIRLEREVLVTMSAAKIIKNKFSEHHKVLKSRLSLANEIVRNLRVQLKRSENLRKKLVRRIDESKFKVRVRKEVRKNSELFRKRVLGKNSEAVMLKNWEGKDKLRGEILKGTINLREESIPTRGTVDDTQRGYKGTNKEEHNLEFKESDDSEEEKERKVFLLRDGCSFVREECFREKNVQENNLFHTLKIFETINSH